MELPMTIDAQRDQVLFRRERTIQLRTEQRIVHTAP
jgi:hypothetical protein